MSTMMERTFKTWLFHLIFILILLTPSAFAIEATFTPNPADSAQNGGTGPLPQSMEQRKQLLELSVAIANTPDPSSTLAHVAQQNGISTEELAGILDRNTKDLQESGVLEEMLEGVNASLAARGGGRKNIASGTLPRRIISLISSIVVAIAKTAVGQISRHPKQSSLLAMVLVLILLTMHNIPKNGLVMSTGTFPPFSRGHTTFLEPPISYMQQHYEDSRAQGNWESSLPDPIKLKSKEDKKSKSNKQPEVTVGGVGMTRSLGLNTSKAKADEVTVKTQLDKEGFSLIANAFQMIPMDDFLDTEQNESQENNELEAEQEAMECMLETISALFEDRTFSEYTLDNTALRWRSFLVADEEEDDEFEGAVMSMRLLGDFGRFGIQPLCFSYELDEEDMNDSVDDLTMIRCVAFHTLKGGHFDGELRFSVDTNKKSRTGVIISVTLAIPIGGRTPSIRLAESMVASLATSIIRSSLLRINQATSRRNQSKHYRARAHGRATEKRHVRYEQEKNQEEMAAERKRRWKRNNPDAGHYRPSGHRLRSPDGSPNFVS